MNKKVIGLIGNIGSGKGTTGNILKKYGYKTISFAEPIKDAVSHMFGWHRDLLEGDTVESRNFRETNDEWWTKKLGREISPRYILQKVGTEAIRDSLHPDIWVFSTFRKIELDLHDKFVITDVRFRNEMRFISEYGGTLIRVKRGHDLPFVTEAREFFKHGIKPKNLDATHVSEWDWVGEEHLINHNIINDGTLVDLEEQIKRIL